MFVNMENMKIKSVLHNAHKSFGRIESRISGAFSVRISGTVKYTFADREFVVNEGEMIFLPKGSTYEFEKISEGAAANTLIVIEGEPEGLSPFFCSVKDFYDIDCILYRMADMWKFGSQSQRCQCLSVVYGLLAYISNADELTYPDKKKFSVIQPAVSYLQKHIYDCELQIDTLHLLCGISHTYFRKIFVARFGTTPKNYVVSKRMSYAKNVIDSGACITVKELAQMAGYKDPLYFGKTFKKHYGVSPANMSR